MKTRVLCCKLSTRDKNYNARGNECVIEEARAQFSTTLESECGIPILHRRNLYLSYTLFDMRDYFCEKFDLYSFHVVNYYANVVKMSLI